MQQFIAGAGGVAGAPAFPAFAAAAPVDGPDPF